MTNQEAKQVLLAYISPNGVGFPDVKEAIKIMIDREEVDAGDCISRRTTLDAIIKRLGIKDETYLLKAEKSIYETIKNMPSVSPKGMSEVIEEIKAEIKRKEDSYTNDTDYCEGVRTGLMFAYQTIDEYTGGAE